jgi:hypothetical protein
MKKLLRIIVGWPILSVISGSYLIWWIIDPDGHLVFNLKDIWWPEGGI